MPTYDYRCNSCGHQFELFQSMSEGVKRKCPECKKMALERLIGTGAAVIFKGSGFYETDYRSKSYTEAKEADTKAASGGDGVGDTKKSGDDSKSKKSDGKAPAKASEPKADAKKNAQSKPAGKNSTPKSASGS